MFKKGIRKIGWAERTIRVTLRGKKDRGKKTDNERHSTRRVSTRLLVRYWSCQSTRKLICEERSSCSSAENPPPLVWFALRRQRAAKAQKRGNVPLFPGLECRVVLDSSCTRLDSTHEARWFWVGTWRLPARACSTRYILRASSKLLRLATHNRIMWTVKKREGPE